MRYLLLFLLITLLVACADSGASNPPAPPMLTPAAHRVPAGPRLTVLASENLRADPALIREFELANGIGVDLSYVSDANSLLERMLAAGDAPPADLLLGIETTTLARALATDQLLPYQSPFLAGLPPELRLDPENRLLPLAYTYVTLNYAAAALTATDQRPPTALEELVQPEWRGMLAVPDPAYSPAGLAFLALTVEHFGEEGNYSWRDFWRELRANDLVVSASVEEALEKHFSGSGPGRRPLVVAYATSHARPTGTSTPDTASLTAEGTAMRQVIFAGIFKQTRMPDQAHNFVDFLLQPAFQSALPEQLQLYPALGSVALPAAFAAAALPPARPVELNPSQIEQNRERWLREWQAIMGR